MDAYRALESHFRDMAVLESINGLLAWDERTKMPPGAGNFRGHQMRTLAGLIHQRRTDPHVGEWLSELEGRPHVEDPQSDSAVTIRLLRRDYDRAVKLPVELVEALAEATVVGQQSWQESRARNSFPDFAPKLEEIVRLVKEKANALGYRDHPYDALLDEYEPDATTREITTILSNLVGQLTPLVATLTSQGVKPPQSILRRPFDVEKQREFGRAVAEQLGFDFQRGRIDETAHPFCETCGPSDCRLTTRYDPNGFSGAFFGTLHEAGHGIYEQGLRAEFFGLPLGQPVSLGIHESQSRMWENFVGRSKPFWQYLFPQLRSVFTESLADVGLDDFLLAINAVEPSLVRVEADEATYNLHIIVRFELERDLMDNSLSVHDLPAAWNEKYQAYLGICPPTDALGVLQDIHWSSGLFGYFPTYTLGNLYAAQLYEKAAADLGDFDLAMQRGEFEALTDWLRLNIHHHGRRYSAAELVQRVTGQPVSSEPLMRYLHSKFA